MREGRNDVDVLIVGAGFADLYALYKIRRMGLEALALEAAPSVGGTLVCELDAITRRRSAFRLSELGSCSAGFDTKTKIPLFKGVLIFGRFQPILMS
jgi:cation diffusion facilitator CzcD-associated flavoprotein CzcO